VGQPQPDILFLALSPDGSRVAVSSHEGDNWDLWIHDVARGTKTRLTFEKSGEWNPAWTPAGDRILYEREATLLIRKADGTTQPEDFGPGIGGSFSPDGLWVAYEVPNPKTRSDIWVKRADGKDPPRALVQTDANEWAPQICPDGSYVAYVSNESGRGEVYLKRFPGGEGKWQVSVDGGNRPIWSRKGDEIFYRNEDDALVVVPVKLLPSLILGTPQVLFNAVKKGLSLRPRSFDISVDGTRFLAVRPLEGLIQRRRILVAMNWLAEFAPSP